MVTAGAARHLYGVVLADGVVDVAATETLRSSGGSSAARGRAPAGSSTAAPAARSPSGRAGAGIRTHDGESALVCACVRHPPVRSVDRQLEVRRLVATRSPLMEANPKALDPARLTDDRIVRPAPVRLPGCLRLLSNDVMRQGEPDLWDIRLSSMGDE